MFGFNDVNTLNIKIFLDTLQKEYEYYHLIIIGDNAGFHRSKQLENEDLSIIFLPSYSPQLNPVERFYQEMRKVTANQIFENIEVQENLIEKALVDWMNNNEKVKNLCAYDWIIEAWKSKFKCNV